MSTLTLEEQAAPSTPGANKVVIYPKADGLLYGQDDAGTERPLVGPTISTVQSTSSGTAISFTGIPTWTKRITAVFDGISSNDSSNPRIQIGDSGGYQTSSYLASSGFGATMAIDTGGFPISPVTASSSIFSGIATLCLMDSATNLWGFSSNVGYSNAAGVSVGGGSKALPLTLDRLRLTAVNGTDTFDAGSINILYE